MAKGTDAEKQELQKRVDDLEKTMCLVLASLPIWIGYEDEDNRFIEGWYKNTHEKFDIRTKGLRD